MRRVTSLRELKRLVERDVKEARGKAIAKVDQELDRVIQSTTEFADLGFDGQDIIDTERLHNSKVLIPMPNGMIFEYDPINPDTGDHYAAPVFYGFFAFGGNTYIEGRKWTNRAVKNENPTVNVAMDLQDAGYDVRIVQDDVPYMDG